MKVYSELDHLRVYELYNKYELKSLLNKINSNNESYEILVNEISSTEDLTDLLNKIYNSNCNLYIYCDVLGNKVSEMHFGNMYINFNNENYILKENFICENFDDVSRIFFF